MVIYMQFYGSYPVLFKNKKMKNSILILYILFFGCLSANAQTYTGKQKDIDKILKNVAQFSEFVMTGDHEGIANCYTSDGKIFPNNRDIMEGTQTLSEYWKPHEGYSVTYHKVTPSEIRIIKKTAYDYGYYEGETQKPDGSKIQWQGKYVIVWKKVKNDWKIYLDIWNSIEKPQKEKSFEGEAAEVNQVIIDLFDGMRAGDSAKVHRCFMDDVKMLSTFVKKDGEKMVKDGDLKSFLNAIGTPHDEVWNEKIRNTKILIDGHFAQAWTEYGFFVGEKFSHCGVDAFLMIKEEGSWKIIHLADTRRRKGCDWE